MHIYWLFRLHRILAWHSRMYRHCIQVHTTQWISKINSGCAKMPTEMVVSAYNNNRCHWAWNEWTWKKKLLKTTRGANKRQSTAHSEIFRPKNNRTKVERIAHKLNAFAYLRLNQIERENSLVPEFDEIFEFFFVFVFGEHPICEHVRTGTAYLRSFRVNNSNLVENYTNINWIKQCFDIRHQ